MKQLDRHLNSQILSPGSLIVAFSSQEQDARAV